MRQIPLVFSSLDRQEQHRLGRLLRAVQLQPYDWPAAYRANRIRSVVGARYVLLTGSIAHALRVATGMLAWKAHDEVILSSLASKAVAMAVVNQGAALVFADIDENTWNMDPVDVASRIVTRTRAIIAVHHAGQSCDMVFLRSLAQRFDLMLIEEASQAVGGRYAGEKLGTFGEIACLGVHVRCHAIGAELGLFITNNAQYAERATQACPLIGHQVQEEEESLRWNPDMLWLALSDPLLRLVCTEITRIVAQQYQRQQIWWYYQERLAELAQAGCIVRPHIDSQAEPTCQSYAFRVRDACERSALLAFLQVQGVRATAPDLPLHLLPGFRRHMADDSTRLPITESVANSLVCLPIDVRLPPDDQERIVEILFRYFRPSRRKLS